MRWSPQIRELDWLTAQPIAHRGLHDASAGIIENSASAFAAAVAAGYAIECDLQLSRDGEAIVFHDDTLERLTEHSGPLRSHTTAELTAITLKGSRDRIQSLQELLDQVAGRVPLVIELKSHWEGDGRLADRALAVLSAYRGAHALMSFDPELIVRVRALSPQTPRGIVADRTTHADYGVLPFGRRLSLRHLGHGWRTRPHFISFHWRDLPFAPVSRFRRRGGPVICWTVRSAEEASQALRYCDQITFEGFRP
jgi:glycerophosphoryl diester phosphodiesterase